MCFGGGSSSSTSSTTTQTTEQTDRRIGASEGALAFNTEGGASNITVSDFGTIGAGLDAIEAFSEDQAEAVRQVADGAFRFGGESLGLTREALAAVERANQSESEKNFAKLVPWGVVAIGVLAMAGKVKL